jgi:hypothetical protein
MPGKRKVTEIIFGAPLDPFSKETRRHVGSSDNYHYLVPDPVCFDFVINKNAIAAASRASDRKDSTPQLRQETTALRDFNLAYVACGSGPTKLTVSITSPLYPRKRTLELVKQDQDDPPVGRRRCSQYRRTLSSSYMKVPGVGFSVDVFTVESKAKTFIARQLDQAEVAEHTDFMKAAEEALRGVRDTMTGPSSTQAPAEAPPTLNPQK